MTVSRRNRPRNLNLPFYSFEVRCRYMKYAGCLYTRHVLESTRERLIYLPYNLLTYKTENWLGHKEILYCPPKAIKTTMTFTKKSFYANAFTTHLSINWLKSHHIQKPIGINPVFGSNRNDRTILELQMSCNAIGSAIFENTFQTVHEISSNVSQLHDVNKSYM